MRRGQYTLVYPLNKHLEFLTKGEIQELVESLGGKYPEVFEKRKRPTFAANDHHSELFSQLKQKTLIHEVKPDKAHPELLRVQAHY